MRILVTGGAGFAGSFLCEHLLAQNHEVWALIRAEDSLGNLEQAAGVRVVRGDVCDRASVHAVLQETRAERVYHLAAFATPAESFRAPASVYEVNFGGTVNLCAAMVQVVPESRLLFVSSADVYGKVEPKEVPLREERAPAPVNPYAGSKAAAEVAVLQFHRSYGLHAVVARPFNHTGPRQSPVYVCSSLAQQVARAEAGGPRVIRAGRLDVARDFSDVRDIVSGYELLLERGLAGGVYHLASGQATPIRRIVERLCSLSTVALSVETDPELERRTDSPVIAGDASKARQLGWMAHYRLDQTLAELKAYWTAEIGRSNQAP